MEDIKVSVTIPVYNTSKYLRECLNSLRNQTLRDIEFIIVDDGSTDESGEICDEFGDQDSRFRIIHQENGGLSSARQTGLDNARGDYVIVCDSDDWVEPEIYEKLYNKAVETDADIVCCGCFFEYNNRVSKRVVYNFKEVDGVVDKSDFLKRGAAASWVKLIRKKLFFKTNSVYTPNINLGEDALIIYKLMRGNPKVVQIYDCLYHYRRLIGEKTYTNDLNKNHINQLKYIYSWLKDNYYQEDYSTLIYQRALDISFAYLRVSEVEDREIKGFLKKEIKWKDILSNNKNLKVIMVVIEKLLPLSFSRLLVGSLYKYFYR